ncbi:hypothetical protein GCM10009803_08670 [Microbacterium ginsengiterrae]
MCGVALTKAPTPGLISMTPWATSSRSAAWTVTGLALWRAVSSRVEGSRAPGDADAIQASRSSRMRRLLL